MNDTFMTSSPQRKGYETSIVDTIFTTRFAYDVNNKMIYMGEAEPGTTESEAKWKIKKFEYTGDNLAAIKYPSGTNNMIFVWDNRASYTYS